MGTGFTIDTPFHIARYGISSVVSLVDDVLIEQMRKHYADVYQRTFTPIGKDVTDARAKRIQAYLDLMSDVIEEQFRALTISPFEPGSEITRYFSLLPEGELKALYEQMLATDHPQEKEARQQQLRDRIQPGCIDVNIMTKLDRLPTDKDGNALNPKYSDAISALRGFALSKAKGGMVFSAGLNAPLYTAISEYDGFLPDTTGESQKKVILKVSDYRSAAIQGRFLAKRGIWVSEFRVESGLNCGGHAFATQGFLLGPILDEFQRHRQTLQQNLHKDYCKALSKKGITLPDTPRKMALTVQGGIATNDEHAAMISHFGMDRTGWGTPFLLVPEVTSLDEEHMKLLANATEDDVALSDNSPLGVPFWVLKTSSSERAREKRIAEGRPGSSCPKSYLALANDATSKPLCRASQSYQALKLKQIEADTSLSQEAKKLLKEQTIAKACICHELGGGVLIKRNIKEHANVSICPSLSILHFKATHTLEEMVGHIYGRWSLIKDQMRPHMFIRELSIYIDYLHREVKRFSVLGSARKLSYYEEFKQNLLEGIQYYQKTFHDYIGEQKENFLEDLVALQDKLEGVKVEA